MTESRVQLRGPEEPEYEKKEDTTYNIIKAVWSHGMYLLEYDSSSLTRLQKRRDRSRESSCGIIQIFTSYWCAVFIILVVLLVLAYQEVGKELSVVMTEETLDEMEIEFSPSNFPFHNLIKLGPQADVKDSIGRKMWAEDSNSQTLSEFLSAVTKASV